MNAQEDKDVTQSDQIRSVDITKELGVKCHQRKGQRLRLYGHVMRMENGIKVKTVMEIEVPGRRPVGRPSQMDR